MVRLGSKGGHESMHRVARVMTAAALALTALTSIEGRAHDRNGQPNWIAEGHYTSPIDGAHCCGIGDCFEVPAHEVQEAGGGYVLTRTGELVPPREVQTSRDGAFWRCRKPDGSRRCFFAPLRSS